MAALAACLLAAPRAGAQILGPRDTTDRTPPRFLAPPVLRPNPNPAVPLAARIAVQTDEPSRVELGFKDGDRSWTVLAAPELDTSHLVPVLGVRADRTTYLWVTALDDAGNARTWEAPLAFTTPPLDDDFPPVIVTAREPDLMEPGVTLFSATSSRFEDGFLVIVDDEGEVVWSYRTPDFVGCSLRISNGNLLYISGRYKLTEIDMFGDPVNIWWASRLHGDEAPPGAIQVAVNSFHHDVIELPPGDEADFAVMSSELRVMPDYPADETDPTITTRSANVVGDVIVEMRRDGTVVRELRIFDVLDPYRINYNSLGEFWTPVYELDDTDDWNHGNAVFHDRADESYVYSSCNLGAVVHFGRYDQHLDWILGAHDGWRAPWDQALLTPIGSGPFEWPYFQHAPEITSAGTILLFDNGKGRSVTPDPPMPENQQYSRAVEFRVDPIEMTVEQVWAFGGTPDEQFLSPTVGDADELPRTRNILMTDGDRDPIGVGAGFSRIAELTRTQPPVRAFEFEVRDLTPVMPSAWKAYRSEHLTSVYP
jgi:arylsulfate sulfotransferase